MSRIRPCRDDERDAILAIINAAAEAYRGVIPVDRWHELPDRQVETSVVLASPPVNEA